MTQRRRDAERTARNAANMAWLDWAVQRGDRAERQPRVTPIVMQADMFDAFSVANNIALELLRPAITQRIATRAKAFGKPVLLLQGDSHSVHASTTRSRVRRT